MLHFSNFKITGIVLFYCWVCCLPCRISCAKKRVCRFRHFPSGTLNLGLDLQGGSHLLLSVDTDAVQRERLEDLTSDIRLALRGERIGYSGLSRVAVVLASPFETAKIWKKLPPCCKVWRNPSPLAC